MSLAEYKKKRKLKPKSHEPECRAQPSAVAKKYVPDPSKRLVNCPPPPPPAPVRQSTASGLYQSVDHSVVYCFIVLN